MMPADVGHSIGQSLTVEGSGVMHRHFQVFYFNGKILGFFADFFRSRLDSFSKQFSKSFPVSNLMNRGNDGLGISPSAWLLGVQKFNHWYGPAAGTEASLARFQRHRIRSGAELKHKGKWIRGIAPARRLYGT